MGQTLSSPATQKTSESGNNARFLYAISEMQGWRITMEDAHAAVLELDEGVDDTNAFFAVYDGHGGGTVAKFAGKNVHKRIIGEETYKEKDYESALKKAFLGTDEDLLADPAHTRDPSGCTAVAALVTQDKIFVANAGDSRSVISVKGEVEAMSFDHKPSNESEKARITAAGGYIEYGRVNGNLALSRAIGDFEFKKNYSITPEQQIITADPDITIHDLSEEDEFFIIACDGIWDCLTSQQAVDFVRYQVSEGKELSEIGEMMCDHCLAPDTSSGAGIGCDNMTVLIVAILHGKSKEEWYSWVTDRVKNEYGYKTPSTLPQLYAQSRINSFKARKEAMDARDRSWNNDRDDNMAASFLGGTGLGGFARVLGSTGGISFHPGSGIMSDGGSLMFADDDSDDDDSGDDDLQGSRSFFSDTLGLGRSHESGEDPTKNLKAQLEEYEKDIREQEGKDDDGDSQMSDALEEQPPKSPEESSNSSTETNTEQESAPGEAPPPPKDSPNGIPASMPQLKSSPGGDEAHPAAKAEGFIDSSEDPLKG